MNPSVIVAIVAAVAAAFSAFVAYRASTRATRVEEKKVDQAAYDVALKYYEQSLGIITTQADRMSSQLDKVSTQLAAEQDVSNRLRSEMRILQQKVQELSRTIAELREHGTPPYVPARPRSGS
jgi:peptidoglycan hydrolase CwlO-like protein